MKLEMDFKNYKKCYYLFNRQKLIEYSKNYYLVKIIFFTIIASIIKFN